MHPLESPGRPAADERRAGRSPERHRHSETRETETPQAAGDKHGSTEKQAVRVTRCQGAVGLWRRSGVFSVWEGNGR